MKAMIKLPVAFGVNKAVTASVLSAALFMQACSVATDHNSLTQSVATAPLVVSTEQFSAHLASLADPAHKDLLAQAMLAPASSVFNVAATAKLPETIVLGGHTFKTSQLLGANHAAQKHLGSQYASVGDFTSAYGMKPLKKFSAAELQQAFDALDVAYNQGGLESLNESSGKSLGLNSIGGCAGSSGALAAASIGAAVACGVGAVFTFGLSCVAGLISVGAATGNVAGNCTGLKKNEKPKNPAEAASMAAKAATEASEAAKKASVAAEAVATSTGAGT